MSADKKTDNKIEETSDSSPTLSPELTAEELAEIERKFDPETAFRPMGTTLGFFIAAVLVAMSVYHFYASG
ncbi:MAG: TRAP transporter permease, partial [Paracoccaceae bacterium]